MKFRNKLLFIAGVTLTMGLLASASAFAARPAPSAPGILLPKGAETLPAYMVSAADLQNEDYMKCVRARMKAPAALNVVENVSAAQDCHSAKN